MDDLARMREELARTRMATATLTEVRATHQAAAQRPATNAYKSAAGVGARRVHGQAHGGANIQAALRVARATRVLRRKRGPPPPPPTLPQKPAAPPPLPSPSPPRDIAVWTPAHVRQWLQDTVGLTPEATVPFEDEDVDGAMLVQLDDEHLIELGVMDPRQRQAVLDATLRQLCQSPRWQRRVKVPERHCYDDDALQMGEGGETSFEELRVRFRAARQAADATQDEGEGEGKQGEVVTDEAEGEDNAAAPPEESLEEVEQCAHTRTCAVRRASFVHVCGSTSQPLPRW